MMMKLKYNEILVHEGITLSPLREFYRLRHFEFGFRKLNMNKG